MLEITHWARPVEGVRGVLWIYSWCVWSTDARIADLDIVCYQRETERWKDRESVIETIKQGVKERENDLQKKERKKEDERRDCLHLSVTQTALPSILTFIKTPPTLPLPPFLLHNPGHEWRSLCSPRPHCASPEERRCFTPCPSCLVLPMGAFGPAAGSGSSARKNLEKHSE